MNFLFFKKLIPFWRVFYVTDKRQYMTDPKTLFIIGNGFDSVHRLPTKYRCFRDFIRSKYNVEEESDALVPESFMLPDGGEEYDKDDVASYIVQVIDNASGPDWGDLETCLGEKLFQELQFDLREVNLDDKDNDIGNDIDVNQQLSIGLRYTFEEMKRLFISWIRRQLRSLNYESFPQNSKIKVMLDEYPNAVFLNFNYTYTLEKMYNIEAERVCHIHGTVDSTEEYILFGHGDDSDVEDLLIKEWGAEIELNALKRYLKKDTKDAIFRNHAFFDNLGSATDIYSYGFSFSEADEVYLEELHKHLAPTAVWHLNQWDSKKRSHYQALLAKNGFVLGADANW